MNDRGCRYSTLFEAMCDDTLDLDDFPHDAHIGVAFVALRRHGFFEAAALLARGIEAMSLRSRREVGFNATITLAFLCRVAECMQEDADVDATAFVSRVAEVLDKHALDPWYSFERLHSPLARRVPLLPDRFVP